MIQTRTFTELCPAVPNYRPHDPMADVFRMGDQYMKRQEYLANADEITFALEGSDMYFKPLAKATVPKS